MKCPPGWRMPWRRADVKTDRKKTPPSLLQILTLAGVAFLGMILVIWLISLLLISRAQNEQFAREQLSLVENEVRDIRRQLENNELLLREFFADTLERAELYDSNRQIQYFGKNETMQNLKKIRTYNPDSGVFFTGRADSFLIMTPVPGSGASFEPHSWLEENLKAGFEGFHRGSWTPVRVGEKDYLYYLFYDPGQNLYVGDLVETDQLLNSLREAVYYPHAFVLKAGQEEVFSSGTSAEGDLTYAYPLIDTLSLKGNIQQTASIWQRVAPLTILLLGLLIVSGSLVLARVLVTRYAKPMVDLTSEVSEAEKDLEHAAIREDNSTLEMYQLSTSIRHLMDEVVVHRMAEYEHQLKDQDRELLMLRSQLRPHFYLNALTTIDAMTYQNRNEDIRRFLAALSVHVRYMLRTDESQITLEDEIRHIDAYMKMQEIRHPGKIVYLIDVPEDVSDIQIPHLVIYTIIENCFKYAFGAEDTLLLMVQARPWEDGVCIRVEDNGPGYPEEILNLFSRAEGDAAGAASGEAEEKNLTPEQKRHIGLRNVIRTMKLWYGRENLLKIHNSHMQGAVTELFFPGQRSGAENG